MWIGKFHVLWLSYVLFDMAMHNAEFIMHKLGRANWANVIKETHLYIVIFYREYRICQARVREWDYTGEDRVWIKNM